MRRLAFLAAVAAWMTGVGAQVLPTPREFVRTGGTLQAPGLSPASADGVPDYAVSSLEPFVAAKGVPLLFVRDTALGDQAYRLDVTASNVIATSSSDAGFVFAAMTLAQLGERQGDGWRFPCCRVDDRPAFGIRGINWNLFVECRCWGQDLMDGEEALVRRSVAAFDRMARYKLNAVFVDGVGWNPERFPGYARLMRRLGAEARRRGIRIGFSGYNAGYGAQYFPWDGPKFTNLTEKGEAYGCFGTSRSRAAGVSGTCLSNERLTAAKAANLKAFVEAVDPGFLYVHGFDTSRQEECGQFWRDRCAACRARWPNDGLLAADGMAGAFAALYDRLCGAADNGRCVFNFVSPGYTDWREDDGEWRFHCDYFGALTKRLGNRQLRVMLREQFIGSDGSPRFAALRRSVGPEARLSAVVFSGCDGFYSSNLFSADVALAKLWKGLDDVYVASGSPYQEARQVEIAEYLWNPEGSPYQIDLPKDPSDFPAFYRRLVTGEERPAAVFGPNGLLDVICRKLYGPELGPEIAALHQPSATPIMPLSSMWMPGFRFAHLRENYGNLIWSDGIVTRAADIARYRAALSSARDATARAIPVFRRAGLFDNAEVCRRTLVFAEASLDWTRTMDLALAALKDASKRTEALVAIARLERTGKTLLAEYEALRKRAVDPSGADVTAAADSAHFLVYEAESMRQTLEKGVWRDHPRRDWW